MNKKHKSCIRHWRAENSYMLFMKYYANSESTLTQAGYLTSPSLSFLICYLGITGLLLRLPARLKGGKGRETLNSVWHTRNVPPSSSATRIPLLESCSQSHSPYPSQQSCFAPAFLLFFLALPTRSPLP